MKKILNYKIGYIRRVRKHFRKSIGLWTKRTKFVKRGHLYKKGKIFVLKKKFRKLSIKTNFTNLL